MILISSMALVSAPIKSPALCLNVAGMNCSQALEDVNLKYNPVLQDVLYYMDRIFTVIFFLEMCVKWLALGFVKYFTNAWCWLDFVIVMVRQLQLCSILEILPLCTYESTLSLYLLILFSLRE